MNTKQGVLSTLLWLGLAGIAGAQVPTGDPSAPPSPMLDPTTSTEPTANDAAHTRSEVLAYLLAIDDQGTALGRLGRDRQVDPQVRAFAATMLTDHATNRAATQGLAIELDVPIVVTADVRERKDIGGSEFDSLGKAADDDFEAGFLDAVAEFDRDVIDLIDKRLVSDADNDTRLTQHLQATRTRMAAQLLRANELRAQGK